MSTMIEIKYLKQQCDMIIDLSIMYIYVFRYLRSVNKSDKEDVVQHHFVLKYLFKRPEIEIGLRVDIYISGGESHNRLYCHN